LKHPNIQPCTEESILDPNSHTLITTKRWHDYHPGAIGHLEGSEMVYPTLPKQIQQKNIRENHVDPLALLRFSSKRPTGPTNQYPISKTQTVTQCKNSSQKERFIIKDPKLSKKLTKNKNPNSKVQDPNYSKLQKSNLKFIQIP